MRLYGFSVGFEKNQDRNLKLKIFLIENHRKMPYNLLVDGQSKKAIEIPASKFEKYIHQKPNIAKNLL